jgi:hypothetical protein
MALLRKEGNERAEALCNEILPQIRKCFLEGQTVRSSLTNADSKELEEIEDKLRRCQNQNTTYEAAERQAEEEERLDDLEAEANRRKRMMNEEDMLLMDDDSILGQGSSSRKRLRQSPSLFAKEASSTARRALAFD